MRGKLVVCKEGKRQDLDFGRIDKRDLELIKRRYIALGYEIKEGK